MSDRFLIRQPETGEEYGLTSVDVFNRRYKSRGFVVPAEQPNGWQVPKGVKGWTPPSDTANGSPSGETEAVKVEN